MILCISTDHKNTKYNLFLWTFLMDGQMLNDKDNIAIYSRLKNIYCRLLDLRVFPLIFVFVKKKHNILYIMFVPITS